MRKSIVVAINVIAILTGFTAIVGQSCAQDGGELPHYAMQHGFVLSADDKFASHLVANGHHSRQVEITGQLLIEDEQEGLTYRERRLQSNGSSYFLFQAQNLDLPTLSVGQALRGHIVESKTGFYEPQNKLVRSAVFQVRNILLNIPNPFFLEEAHRNSANPSKCSSQQESPYSNALLNAITKEKRHCCDTGEKPCNWKC
jgi:hypothetical protein